MKVGGGLNYVIGPMGSGKSYYGVRKIVSACCAGQYAITNVELREDAFQRIAAHVARFSTRRRRDDLARRLAGFYVFETELTEAVKYRVPGKGEARAVFVWDETHNDLNNRNWRERAALHKTDRGTDALLEWATQLRKLGFVGYLLSQHHENTDAALRRVCNYLVRMQNQKDQTRALGLRVTPWPLFLACWYTTNTPLTDKKVKPVKVERYFLGWHRKLYDTFGLYHGLAGDDYDGTILLPAGGRGAPAVGGSPAVGEVPATASGS